MEPLQNIRIFISQDTLKFTSNCKQLNRICLGNYCKLQWGDAEPHGREFVEIKKIINSNKTSLKHICLYMCDISDSFFDSLIEIDGFK